MIFMKKPSYNFNAIVIAIRYYYYYYINLILFAHRNQLSTINSKINGTCKGVYFPISKLHSILAVLNLLIHNNMSINNNYYYYVQVNSLRLKLSLVSKWASKHFWGYHLF